MNELYSIDITGLDEQEALIAILIRTALTHMRPAEARERLDGIMLPAAPNSRRPRLDAEKLAALIDTATAAAGVALAEDAAHPDSPVGQMKPTLAESFQTVDSGQFVRRIRPVFIDFLQACAAALAASDDA